MTAAFIQAGSANAGVATPSVAATFAGTATSGNLLVAALSYRGTSTSHSDPSGWTKQCDVQGPGFDGGRLIFYWRIASGSETGLSIGCSAIKKSLYIAEWSGVESFDQEHEADSKSASTTMSGGTITPAAAGGVIFAGFNQSARNPSIALQSPFTEDYDRDVDASGPSVVFGHLIDDTFSGSYSGTAISSQSDGYGAFIVSFAAGTPSALVADFSGTPTVGIAPLEVDFTDLTTGDPQTWQWDFGDGTILEYGLGEPPASADTFELTTIIGAATAVGTAYVKLTAGAGTTPAQPIAIPTPAGTAYFIDWADDGSYDHLDAAGTAYSDLGEASELEGVIRELPVDIGAGAEIAARVAVMLTSGGTISRLMAGGVNFGTPNFTETP